MYQKNQIWSKKVFTTCSTTNSYPVAAKFDQNWMMLSAKLASFLEKLSVEAVINEDFFLSASDVPEPWSRNRG